MYWPFRTSLLTCLTVVAFQAWAQPSLHFDTTTVDLGTIPQGSPAVFYFDFTNTGDSPLMISYAKSSCGCMTTRWDQEPIPPGGRGLVIANYDSNRLGACMKSVTVVSNDSLQPFIRLTLRCHVTDKGPSLEFREESPRTLADALSGPGNFMEPLPGSTECRPRFLPPSGGDYVLRVHNPNGVAVRLDVGSYCNPEKQRYGVFLCKQLTTNVSDEMIIAGWGKDYLSEMVLPAHGYCLLVVHDRAWLEGQIMVNRPKEWALPVGVTWEVP